MDKTYVARHLNNILIWRPYSPDLDRYFQVLCKQSWHLFLSRQVVTVMRPKETPAHANLRAQIREQRVQLNSMSMVDEFAMYARAERRLNKLQSELNAIGKPTFLLGNIRDMYWRF